jgi:uncharacterized protein YuzE
MSRDLQLTFRGGRVLAAYLYFRRGPKITSARTKREPDGMIVDFDADGAPIGIEFIAPSKLTLAKVNGLLQSLGQSLGSADEFWPLIKPAANMAVPA